MLMIQSRCGIAALGALIALTAVGPARAQVPRGALGFQVLRDRSLQRELRLSDEQSKQVDLIVEEAVQKLKDELKALPEAGRTAGRAEVFRSAQADAMAAVRVLLKPEQGARLDQILVQQRGVDAFDDPEIQGKLRLTDGQKKAIRAIVAEIQPRLQKLHQESAGNRPAATPKIVAVYEESLRKAVAVLDEDQKRTWKDLSGAPFTFDFERPRPGANR